MKRTKLPAPSVHPSKIAPPHFVLTTNEKMDNNYSPGELTNDLSNEFDSLMGMLDAPDVADTSITMGSDFDVDSTSKEEPAMKKQKRNSNEKSSKATTRSERNRIHARRARLRRKIFIQVLEKSLEKLTGENQSLKSILFSRFGINFDEVYRVSNSSIYLALRYIIIITCINIGFKIEFICY